MAKNERKTPKWFEISKKIIEHEVKSLTNSMERIGVTNIILDSGTNLKIERKNKSTGTALIDFCEELEFKFLPKISLSV